METQIPINQFELPDWSELNSDVKTRLLDLEHSLGVMPNLYRYMAKNPAALDAALGFNLRKSTLTHRELVVVKVIGSVLTECNYCLSVYAQRGYLNGFSRAQVLELYKGRASFDPRLDALAKLAYAIFKEQGRAPQNLIKAFFEAGYEEEHLIDCVLAVSSILMGSYMNNLIDLPIDFPAPPKPINQ
jgi:AhpD family alkylhydroperoxidase